MIFSVGLFRDRALILSRTSFYGTAERVNSSGIQLLPADGGKKSLVLSANFLSSRQGPPPAAPMLLAGLSAASCNRSDVKGRLYAYRDRDVSAGGFWLQKDFVN